MSVRLRLTRRDWMCHGTSAFFGLAHCGPAMLAGAESDRATTRGASIADGPIRPAKSVILIYLPGGLSQHDSFDLKPHAPSGVRGEFQPISTDVPGIDICEHLPLLARRCRQFALVRSMSHGENNHFPATHKTLTGHTMPRQLPGDASNAATRHDWPCYASAYDSLRPRNDGVPNGVSLPHPLAGGATPWPGQHGGFLSPRHDPWQLHKDPNQNAYRDDSLVLPAGVTIERVDARRRLLEQFERERGKSLAVAESGDFRDLHRSALHLMTSGNMARAFELEREPDAVRNAYGRHSFGQSLLLARRLVQAGVRVVQANMGPVQTWDTHENNFAGLRDTLLPPLDRGLSALLDDLDETGMLSETLVVMTGEFGRTPAISLVPGAQHVGRNHWAHVYTALFAGGGVCGGRVIGASDALGSQPLTRSYSPDDLGTTILAALGVLPDTLLRDQLNRPMPVCGGRAMAELYGYRDDLSADSP